MSTGSGPGASAGQFSPHIALEKRARDLTTVEAAVLVISPALDDADLFSYYEQFETLHERIDALSSLLGQTEDLESVAERASADFAELGSGLGALLQKLRTQIREVDVSRLRPVVRKLCETNRSDVEALLDLCLDDPDEFEALWPLTDLLIGRLATGQEDGKGVMMHDPSRLTPRLWEVCQQVAERLPSAATSVSPVFFEALSEVDAADALEDLEITIERIYTFKATLGDKRLLPGVLRSSVLYNIAVANRIDFLHDDEEGELIACVDLDLDDLDAAEEPKSQRPLAAKAPPKEEPERPPLTPASWRSSRP